MRHERLLLTIDESRALIAEMQRWIRRTGTNYNKLATAAGVNPSIRSDVRFRNIRLTITTAEKVRSAMASNPRGISKAQHKRCVARRARERLARVQQRDRIIHPALPVRVDRSPCPRCGTRKDIGCKHWEKVDG